MVGESCDSNYRHKTHAALIYCTNCSIKRQTENFLNIVQRVRWETQPNEILKVV